MPGTPIIIRDLLDEQLEHLEGEGRLAFVPRFRLRRGERLMIWWERRARWVHAIVDNVIEKPSYSQLEEYLELTPYDSVEKWLGAEESRLGGFLPRRVTVISLLG